MHLSVIVPLFNEQDSLEELHQRIVNVVLKQGFNYEIIFVDDGSTDNSWEIIKLLGQNNSSVKGIKLCQNYGKSKALNVAFEKCVGDVVITMDADLQDFPEEIPELYNMIHKDGFDLVSGWKQNRQDNTLTKNFPSKLFNKVAQITSGLKLHDFNCGLKAYKKEVVKELQLYSGMHRYIPIIAKQKGFVKITEKKVKHVARKHGKSKFGNARFIQGFLDLITLSFINKFGNKPMHLFGAIGTIMFILGFIASLYIGSEKLYTSFILKQKARLITQNPFFYIALTFMLLGTQLFLAGFLGEILVRLKGKPYTRISQEF